MAAQSYLSAQLKESTAEKESSLHDVFSAVVSVPIKSGGYLSLSLSLVLSLTCTIFPVGTIINFRMCPDACAITHNIIINMKSALDCAKLTNQL